MTPADLLLYAAIKAERIAQEVAADVKALTRRRVMEFNVLVDAELIEPFQKYVYYPLIIVFTANLMFAADGPPESIEASLGPLAYHFWLGLGTFMPALSLFGRWLYNSAAKKRADQRNSAYGGAWFMFAGDLGVWAAILIYLMCVWQTFHGQGLWGVGFVVMGVPGGLFFTYRSIRRIRQINERAACGT